MEENDKVTEATLVDFASGVIKQQLEKGIQKGYAGFENSSVASLTGQAIAKLVTGNWQSALAYVAMAVAVWYNSQQ